MFNVLPYLQNPGSDQMTIIWQTTTAAYGWVEYGPTREFGFSADKVIDGLRAANTKLHKVSLTSLQPATTYYYRACYRPILEFGAYKVKFAEAVYSETYSFKTLPSAGDSEISCVIFSDLHDDYYEILWQLQARLTRFENYDFTIFNGDTFAEPPDKNKFAEVLNHCNKGVAASEQPALYIRGNHETRGGFARKMKEMFDFPGDNYFFAMSAGPVRFIFLDTGEDKPDNHPAYSGLNDFSEYRLRQRNWLAEEVKSPTFQQAAYRVLVLHIPFYNIESRFTSKPCRELWEPVLDQASIDIAICGHTHKPVFIPANTDNNKYPVMIGGGPKPENCSVITLTADAKRLSVKMLDIKGNTIGEYSSNAKTYR